jgi:CheY-like chemotaxis protein/HPt (histidine-containing phosphotransfer) domain-containing protein
VNEVLDYSKIQAGKFTFEQAPFSPKQLIEEVITLMNSSAQLKNILLQLNFKTKLPETITGDPVRLRQVLYNLIGNAIKFTSKGKVTVEVSTLLQSRTSVTLQVKVEDTGIGIAKQNLRKIFNEFEQADVSISGLYGGTGLGLSICKKLVELQKGKLSLSSEAGKGTTVLVNIPYTISSQQQIAEVETVDITTDLKGIRILLADDEVYNRRLLETILRKWNTSITLVEDGKAVWNEFQKNEYDLLLLDIRMPEMSGEEVCKRIRTIKDKTKAGVPLIALTAIASPLEMERYREAGFNDCLSKPFAEADLLEKVTSLLESVQEGRSSKSVEGKIKVKEATLFNLTELEKMSAGNNAFFGEMVQLFITSTRNGMKQLTDAARNKKWEMVADAAHRIIPPCRHVEANVLLEGLKKIELQARKKDVAGLPALIEQMNQHAGLVISKMQEQVKV